MKRIGLVFCICFFCAIPVWSLADRLATDDISAVYRTGKIDPYVLKVPARIQSALSKDSAESKRELAAFLVAGAENDFVKVKRLHDWITENIAYDTDGFYGDGRASDPLKERRATCGGFAWLFLELAIYAGVNAVSITGRSRSTFDSKTNTMASHVWSAVEIGGKWYIVDTTHDDRFGYDNRASGKKGAYRDTQLFISPAAKIVEIFPDEERYQFLPRPWSFAEFLAHPHINMNFLRHGVVFANGMPGGISKENLPARGSRYFTVADFLRPGAGTVTMRLQAPEGVTLFARVTSATGKSHEAHALCVNNAGASDCSFSAPGNGEYKAYISARERARDTLFTKIYEFTLIGSDGTGPQLPPANDLAVLDASREYGVKIVNHNFADRTAQEYFAEVEYPNTCAVAATLSDDKDRKIVSGSKASRPEAGGGGMRIRFTFYPQPGTSLVRLRVKPAGAKLYNDTAAVVRLVR